MSNEYKIVKKFKVSGQDYELRYANAEFILYLYPDINYVTRNNDESDWLFWDEPVIDDVDLSIDVFDLLIQVKKYIVEYVYKNNITYFFFIASTDRKIAVYERLAKQLAQLLNYTNYNNNNTFYICK